MSAFANSVMLRKLSVFQGLTDKELDLLAMVMRKQDYAEGDFIINEGEPGHTCYFIVRGEVEVRKRMRDGRLRTITTLRGDQMFGHVSLIDAGPRSASCVATRGTRCLLLDRADFDTLFQSGTRFAFKFQEVIGRTVASQLRSANERLSLLAVHRGSRMAKADRRQAFEDVQVQLIAGDTAQFARKERTDG